MTTIPTIGFVEAVAAATAIAMVAAIGYGCVRFLLTSENLWAWLAGLSLCF